MKDNPRIKGFTQLPNFLIEFDISHAAFRVLVYMLSKPPSWEFNNTDIQKRLRIKQGQSLANYWKELIQKKIVLRSRKRDKNGKLLGGFTYTINAEVWKNHNTDNPIMEKPQYVKTIIRSDHNTVKPKYGKTTDIVILNTSNTKDSNTNKKRNIDLKEKKPNGFSAQKKSDKSLNLEKEKKVAAKKRREVVEKMKVVFEKYWQIVIQEDSKFDFEDQKQLTQLKNLKSKIERQLNNSESTNDLVTQFEFFLQNVIDLNDKYYLESFTPATLSSKFNEIVTKIKINKNGITNFKKGHQFDSNKRKIGETFFGKNI